MEVGIRQGDGVLLSEGRELLASGGAAGASGGGLPGGDGVPPATVVEHDVDVVGEGHLELSQAVWRGKRGREKCVSSLAIEWVSAKSICVRVSWRFAKTRRHADRKRGEGEYERDRERERHHQHAHKSTAMVKRK